MLHLILRGLALSFDCSNPFLIAQILILLDALEFVVARLGFLEERIRAAADAKDAKEADEQEQTDRRERHPKAILDQVFLVDFLLHDCAWNQELGFE
jgi:hypothetical protein